MLRFQWIDLDTNEQWSLTKRIQENIGLNFLKLQCLLKHMKICPNYIKERLFSFLNNLEIVDDAQNDAELLTIKDSTIERLRAYLGLVFEHYINGIELIDHQGNVHPKNINMKVLGIDVDPIDPLMKDMINVTRNGVRGNSSPCRSKFISGHGSYERIHS